MNSDVEPDHLAGVDDHAAVDLDRDIAHQHVDVDGASVDASRVVVVAETEMGGPEEGLTWGGDWLVPDPMHFEYGIVP